MAKIIYFGDRKNDLRSGSRERNKALAEDRIRVFTCDTCGEDIEVCGDLKPKRCPGCGLTITQWNSPRGRS